MSTDKMSEENSALIAMSGGVDSSVAAYLMKEQGYRCMGTTMRLYNNSDTGEKAYNTCCSQKDIYDAAEVAVRLDIPYEVFDLIDDFREKIIERFIHTYESGGVPNPCVDCNRLMKFERLMDFAREKGLYYLVTGHYARIRYDEERGRYLLMKSAHPAKDQSYVLYTLTQEQLAHMKFPLGEYEKDETRAIAARMGFKNASKHDSQDICFVPDGDYVGFMERFNGRKYPDGDIVDESGRVLGTHHGTVRYTPGQRRGLGIAAEHPLYVIRKDMQTNTVVVGPESSLYSDTLYADHVNWVSIAPPSGEIRVKAKTRYRQKEQWATAIPTAPDKLELIFDDPQRAITPGQSVVMYDGDIVVGGGIITGTHEQL